VPSGVPELGTLNRKKIAKLVGVAPLARDSGTFVESERAGAAAERSSVVRFRSTRPEGNAIADGARAGLGAHQSLVFAARPER
jgi:hypothetical protein